MDGVDDAGDRRRIEASVSAKDPRTAVFTGEASAEVESRRGLITVRVDLRVTTDSAVANGEVVELGQRIFERRWTAVPGH